MAVVSNAPGASIVVDHAADRTSRLPAAAPQGQRLGSERRPGVQLQHVARVQPRALPVGQPDLRLAQQSLERMQTDAIRETLAGTDAFRPLYRWNWLLRKQINTMKMQLYFQLKENDKVDALLPKCFLMDSRSLAIKLVRMFKNGDPGLDKFYDKKCRKLKGEDGAFVALTYAWIKLRQDQPEPARSALVAARKSSDNPVLKENYERLVNGKFKQFSNSGLGDAWYALYLEEPKIKPQRVQQQRMY